MKEETRILTAGQDISRILVSQEETAPFDQSNILYFEPAVHRPELQEPLKPMEGSRDSDFFFKSGFVVKERKLQEENSNPPLITTTP